MEIKAQLNKPYTDKQRIDFIIIYNHNQGYEIRESDNALQAWGYTEEEIAEQEQERIQSLYMTRSDFFDGFILAFGLGQAELRVIVEQILNSINITDIEIKVALNNYDNALNFYRKHTLFTLLNGIEIPLAQGVDEDMVLIFTSDIWDKFFDTKDYTELQKAIQPIPEPEPVDDDSDNDTDTDDEDTTDTTE